MIYWAENEYNERYFIRFGDVDGGQWKISIQDPTFEASVENPVIELTGGAEPVEWEGNGDESQTEVVLGSTGKLRIICLEGQESLFTEGNILPSIINDRRIQVLKQVGASWGIVWQGFIKPETLSQDWDATPYEIELPIVSPVAATEYFTMPDETGTEYGLFREQTNIAGLLRAIIISLGINYQRILTNKPFYEDFNGTTQQTSGGETAHWTQGAMTSSFFYENEDGEVKPKTFKDVLECICYPYGKIQEMEDAQAIAILMRWKDDAGVSASLYSLPVWSNYDQGVMSTETRFGYYSLIQKVQLADIQTNGTDNTLSNVTRPKSVSFTNDVDSKDDIFELTEKYIKPTFPITDSLDGLTSLETVDFSRLHKRFVYAINKQYLNLEFGDDWTFSNQSSSLADFAFCRVVEVSGDHENALDYSIPVPIAFCFNVNAPSASMASVSFTLRRGVISRNSYNHLKLTLKTYYIARENAIDGEYSNIQSGTTELRFVIQDKTNGLYLHYNSNDDLWFWNSSAPSQPLSVKDCLKHDGDDNILWFNENRAAGDNSVHFLNFTLVGISTENLSGNTYAKLYTTFKLEYVNPRQLYNKAVAANFSKNIGNTGNSTTYGGNGDDLDINFETLAGRPSRMIDGSCLAPYNSFCNAQKYIDTANREKIEIDAAHFEIYYHTDYFNLATSYAVVTDGNKVLIPVAVGMNPRMNTIKLTLVSTNVTS